MSVSPQRSAEMMVNGEATSVSHTSASAPEVQKSSPWKKPKQSSSADSEMERPLVWLTNNFNRSPGELVWVKSNKWGPLNGSLIDISYGMGRIFVVPYEKVNGQLQGGEVAIPIPDFKTGVMRGRFSPADG